MDLAEKIADYMVETGLNNTSSGNYYFQYHGLNQKFGCNLPGDYRLIGKIIDQVYEKYGAAIAELCCGSHPDDGFDFMFYLNYCPNAYEAD